MEPLKAGIQKRRSLFKSLIRPKWLIRELIKGSKANYYLDRQGNLVQISDNYIMEGPEKQATDSNIHNWINPQNDEKEIR